MEISKHHTIQELGAYNQSLLTVLDRFAPTYRMPEQSTLHKVCEQLGLDTAFVVSVLQAFDAPGSVAPSTFQNHAITDILRYLQITHRYYLDTRLFQIEYTIEKLLAGPADVTDHSTLVLASRFFEDYNRELSQHIMEEEARLFPYIRRLLNPPADHYQLHRMLNSYSIQHFEDDHDSNIEDDLGTLRQTLLISLDTDNTFSLNGVLLRQIEHLEHDLRIHALVEDEVLIPKALKLEQQLHQQLQESASFN